MDLPDEADGLVLVEDAVARPLLVQQLGRERTALRGGEDSGEGREEER